MARKGLGAAAAASRGAALVLTLAIGSLVAPMLPPVFGLRAELAQYGAVVQPDGGLRFTQPIPAGIEAGLAAAWREQRAAEAAHRKGSVLPGIADLREAALLLLNPIAVALMMAAYWVIRLVQRRLWDG